MEAYFDASVTASILVREVMKELKIRVTPGECCKNGLDKKVFNRCKKIIEKEYSDRNYQEVLKLYVSSYFIEDSVDESGYEFEDYDSDTFQNDYEEYFDDSINLAS